MILKAATLQTGRQNHSHRKLFKVSPLLYETRPLGCWHPGDPCFPEDRTFITCTNKVLSPAQAPMRFELMISCLRDRRFNQLSHGARHFQRLVKFSKASRIGDVVEKMSRFHRDLNSYRWIQSPESDPLFSKYFHDPEFYPKILDFFSLFTDAG